MSISLSDQLSEIYLYILLKLHNDDTSHMEAFDQLLVAWVNILSSSSSFPKDFLSAPCLQILHLYIRTHISAPEGTRNPQGVQDLEEFVELRDTDLEEFDEQLSSVAKLARHVLGEALPFLNHMLEVKIATFMEHLCTLKEKGSSHFTDLHSLLTADQSKHKIDNSHYGNNGV